MSTRSSADEADLVPADLPATTAYDRDFYSWTLEQARLVREGRWDGIDRANLAEEIESLGREQFDKLESALHVLLIHMLKWDQQPNRRGRSWLLAIEEQRVRVSTLLSDNPGLKPRVPDALARAYRLARIRAMRQTGLQQKQFPQECPYAWDDVVGREFSL